LALNSVSSILAGLSDSAALSPQAWAQGYLSFVRNGIRWPFPYWLPSLIGDFTNLAVLIVLIRRFARSRRDEERLESEMEAARTVQRVLIPDEVPTIPGFQIQAVYQPASQVGGDFFQIVATRNGGALIAIGDVSGKGMPAAMTVSLLVGTFRTLAHYTQSPAEILRAMNQRLLTRSDGGFTTCLVLRADAGGGVTAANAGHPAPYLGGRELPIDPGLPLGLAADSRYSESRFRLEPGGNLTLLTDGVPEARDAAGHLFGFENTAAISNQSVEFIAEAARRFGQEDDVTVIRLTLEAAAVSESPAWATPGATAWS
jgi:serine phosphatase RsbU (regulator of sigma subunit)